MIDKNKTYKIGLHILIWILFILFNYLFIKANGLNYDIRYQGILMAINIIVFYGFYSFIIPLLFKKRIFAFILLTILLLGGSFYVRHNTQRHHLRNQCENSFRPHDFKRNYHKKFMKPHFRNERKMVYDALGIMFFFFMSLIISFVQKWQNVEKSKILLEKEKTDAELYFLKQQINPHFLFNSLNSIYSLSIDKADEVTESILKLSSILRYVLYDSENKKVYLKDEIDVIKNYIELQKLRLTESVKLSFNVVGKLEDYKIEPLLLIPILENAFKHSIDNINIIIIDISIVIKHNLLHLITQNTISKVVRKEEDVGIGLKNIKRRLEILYPDQHSLEISRTSELYIVDLKIRLKQ